MNQADMRAGVKATWTVKLPKQSFVGMSSELGGVGNGGGGEAISGRW